MFIFIFTSIYQTNQQLNVTRVGIKITANIQIKIIFPVYLKLQKGSLILLHKSHTIYLCFLSDYSQAAFFWSAYYATLGSIHAIFHFFLFAFLLEIGDLCHFHFLPNAYLNRAHHLFIETEHAVLRPFQECLPYDF